MKHNSDYGTFKDAKRAPIHRWFQYPSGYSYKLVWEKIKQFNLNKSALILDPFLGCGTTCLAAKQVGIDCVGIEAHSFVANIAKVKLTWDYNVKSLREDLEEVLMTKIYDPKIIDLAKRDFQECPDLLKKCFSDKNLTNLFKIKHSIKQVCDIKKDRDFFDLALVSTLRLATSAGTGWPYIAPSKFQSKKSEKDGITVFKKQAELMIHDVLEITKDYGTDTPTIVVIEGDARKIHDIIKPETVDLVLTSPPYLNNYDYADRTRLETYFFGIAKDWKGITEKFRDKLMVSATTQTKRTNFDSQNPLSKDLMSATPKLSEELTQKIIELSKRRLKKGGKKNYDIMVSQYFNDIFPIIKNTYTYLKKDGVFILVLGDSAPYGVHIPTEIYIGEIGKSLGFKKYEIEELRKRGDKWANNPQRHKVKLRESILTLYK